MRTSTFDLHARAASVDLDGLLKKWRSQDPPVSYAEITHLLRERGVRVSYQTVARWCAERGIESSRPRAARKENAEVAPVTPDAHVAFLDGGSDPDGAEIEGEARLPAAAATPPESALERELRLSREASK